MLLADSFVPKIPKPKPNLLGRLAAGAERLMTE
jgi:hypothetical protein